MAGKGKPFYGYSRTIEVGVAATTTTGTTDVPLWSAPFRCKINKVSVIPAATITGATTNNCTISVVNKGATGTLSDNIASVTYDNGIDATAYVKNSLGDITHEQLGNLAYDTQTGNFTAGLTVTGGSSSATGVVVSDTEGTPTTSGTLLMKNISGVFEAAENITDTSTGAAKASASQVVIDEISRGELEPGDVIGLDISKGGSGLATPALAVVVEYQKA